MYKSEAQRTAESRQSQQLLMHSVLLSQLNQLIATSVYAILNNNLKISANFQSNHRIKPCLDVAKKISYSERFLFLDVRQKFLLYV